MPHKGYPKRGQRAATNKQWHNPGAYADMIRKKGKKSATNTGGASVGGGT